MPRPQRRGQPTRRLTIEPARIAKPAVGLIQRGELPEVEADLPVVAPQRLAVHVDGTAIQLLGFASLAPAGEDRRERGLVRGDVWMIRPQGARPKCDPAPRERLAACELTTRVLEAAQGVDR